MIRLLLILAAALLLRVDSAPAQTAPDGADFVASRRGRVFYARTCAAWRTLSRANLVWFGTAAEARAAGYGPSRSAGCAPGNSAAASSAAAASTQLSTCVLARVVDGDTLECQGGIRVRLLLIDTPEMDQGPYGKRARQYLVELVPLGTPLKVDYDLDPRDRYGRTLAYLFAPDGRMVNEEIALAGYAVVSVYPPNVKHVDRLRLAVEVARSARVGLWETSAFDCSPADHRANRCQ